MNGINYSSLLSNAGLFSNQATSVQEETKYKSGNVSEKKTSANENVDHDTVEINGQSRQVQKACYDRPKRVQPKQEQEYKALDANGIQEGIELSDAALDLLKELREKYGNMEISVAKWSTDEEQDYYARGCKKDYSVLIDPELLEKMAADESVRAEYEAVLDQADDNSAALTEALGEDADRVENFRITIDANGKVSYAVELIKDFEERNAKRAENASKKSAADIQSEKLEERREKRRAEEKERRERIFADSMDELIERIKNRLYPEETQEAVMEDATVEEAVE